MVLELIFKWSTSTFHFHFLSFWLRRYINDIYNFFSSHYRKTQLLLYQIDIFVHFLCNPSNHVSVSIFDLICVFGSVTILLKYNVRSNEAKWPHKSGWIKSHFWLSQPNQACNTIFSIRIWCSTTFSLTVWRNSAKWRFRQFFYPLFCGHLASFFRTSCFKYVRSILLQKVFVTNKYIGLWQKWLQSPLKDEPLEWIFSMLRQPVWTLQILSKVSVFCTLQHSEK